MCIEWWWYGSPLFPQQQIRLRSNYIETHVNPKTILSRASLWTFVSFLFGCWGCLFVAFNFASICYCVLFVKSDDTFLLKIHYIFLCKVFFLLPKFHTFAILMSSVGGVTSSSFPYLHNLLWHVDSEK